MPVPSMCRTERSTNVFNKIGREAFIPTIKSGNRTSRRKMPAIYNEYCGSC
jgi:hypothetical protein